MPSRTQHRPVRPANSAAKTAEEKAWRLRRDGPIIDILFVRSIACVRKGLEAKVSAASQIHQESARLEVQRRFLRSEQRGEIDARQSELNRRIQSLNTHILETKKDINLLLAAKDMSETERIEMCFANMFPRQILGFWGLPYNSHCGDVDGLLYITEDIRQGGPICRDWAMEDFSVRNSADSRVRSDRSEPRH